MEKATLGFHIHIKNMATFEEFCPFQHEMKNKKYFNLGFLKFQKYCKF